MKLNEILEPCRVSSSPKTWLLKTHSRDYLSKKIDEEVNKQVKLALKRRMIYLEEVGIINLPLLQPKELRILHSRLYESKTLEEVGKEYNICFQRVSQILNRSFEKFNK